MNVSSVLAIKWKAMQGLELRGASSDLLLITLAAV